MAKPLKTMDANACPKCSKPMERRSHKQPPTKKPFYFSEWDYCPKCRHVQHYEEFKVVVEPKKHVMSQMGEVSADELRDLKIEAKSKFDGRMEIDTNTGEFTITIRGKRSEMTPFAWSKIEQFADKAHGRKLAK